MFTIEETGIYIQDLQYMFIDQLVIEWPSLHVKNPGQIQMYEAAQLLTNPLKALLLAEH